jgi:trans-aconitate 2-methyltransferase
MKIAWNPNLYDDKHDFVFKFGEEIVSLLNPQKNETILDLGCGTGDLTQQIGDACHKVIGLDNSLEMILKAKEKHTDIEFVQANAMDFQLDTTFDAVFSNATLHWIPDAESVIKNINKHLKVGGRFVAEFGGKGCVNNIISTLTTVLDEKNIAYPPINSVLYYPSVGEYAHILEKNGFELAYGALFDRPTELKDGYNGVGNWIEMFLHWTLKNVDEAERISIKAEVSKRLESKMYDGQKWIADYRRIRIVAIKTK